ncbi:hypothetical protein [Actinophytocola xinjiangensis]|uniref:hypothetical protein n=1 Tax=Actinophytocola xinjiangensis TaxID=485602 RepID=UPI0012B8D3C1|nr:hypothetical protein [Actinophytocola xinjiangensis]
MTDLEIVEPDQLLDTALAPRRSAEPGPGRGVRAGQRRPAHERVDAHEATDDPLVAEIWGDVRTAEARLSGVTRRN